MPISTLEWRESRRLKHVEAHAILDKQTEEKRSPTAEERTIYDRIMLDADAIRDQIEDAEKRNTLERNQLEEKTRADAESEEENRNKPDDRQESTNPRGTVEYRNAFDHWLTGNQKTLTDEEHRALSAGTATEGGYLYASEEFVDTIISDVTDATVYRGLANGLTISNADSLGIPTLTDRMSAAVWTSELGIPSTDSDLAFGKRALTPHPLAKEIRVSKVLLRKVPNAQAIVRSELARVVAEANENAFMTGDGAQRPLGIFTASADGISTSRDVSNGNTTTSPTFDGLKAAKYSLKQVYWANASWLFHRNVMEVIAKLKDGNGRYLLQDSVVEGEPDRMLGFSVNMSEFAPSTLTAGLYVGMLADHSNYWIVDALDMQITRAEELFVRQNQDLFIIRMETDGAPVREEAFARVTLAT